MFCAEGLGLDWHGPKLIGRLTSQAELERLVDALLTQLGGTTSAGERKETGREKVYFPMIAAAADRILELCPIDQAPIPATPPRGWAKAFEYHHRRARLPAM